MSLLEYLNSPQLSSYLSTVISRLYNLYSQHPRATVAASIAAIFFPWAVNNFRQFKALGKNGFPNAFVGWTVATLLKPIGRWDTTSTGEYDRDTNKDAWLKGGSGPLEIPRRVGPRPKTGWHFTPHRQVERYTSEKVASEIQMLVDEFREIIKVNSGLVHVQVSPHERLGDAIMVHPSIPSPHKVTDEPWREIAHIHEHKDFSMHVTLSPQDCKLVIEQGWGERHPLSGRLSLPKENLLIYGPRDEDDVRVAGLIIRASVGYMTGHKDMK